MFLPNNEILQAICRTMGHSLWQGIVLAMLAGVIIVLTRKTSAALRYNLLGFLGLAFILCVGITFYLQIQTNIPATFQHQLLESSQDASSPVLVTYHNQDLQQQRQTVIGSVAGFLDYNAPYIVAVWLVVFLFKCVQLIRGLRQIHQLRHRHLSPVPAHWNTRLEELKKRLGVKGAVWMKESPLVKTPAVVGFLKPIILLPLGMLTHMPAAEAEAIILHELAHIRRKDYLVNLVQGFGEIVFFYNPGFIWVSSVMKTERENCCDDMAVAVTQSKAGFVSALVSSQEYGWNNNQLVLGFSRKKTPLLDRAKRLLQNNNQSLNNTEKTFLSLCIVLGLCVAIAFKSKGQTEDSVMRKTHKAQVMPEVKNTEIPYSDQVYRPEDYPEGTALEYTDELNGYTQTTYLFKHKGTLYQVTGDIRLLKVDGVNIPQENWQQYMPVVEMLMDKYRQYGEIVTDAEELEDLEALAPLDEEDALSPIEMIAPPAPPAPPTPPAPPAPISLPDLPESISFAFSFAISPDDSVALSKEQAKALREMMEQVRKAQVELEKAVKEMKKVNDEMRKAEIEMKQADIEMAKANLEMGKAEIERLRAEKVMEKAELEMQKTMAKEKEIEAMHQALSRDLRSALGIEIESYGLSQQELIVNGKKQSSTLHKQMVGKYLKKVIDMSYHYDIKTGRVFKGSK